MASVNWKKMTTQAAGAMYTHLDEKARITHDHANVNIDKSLTKENYIIGAHSFAEAIRKMKARTNEVDSVKPPKRKKKDRVTCCMLEFSCPEQISTAGREKEFFQKMHEETERFFGKDNVYASFVHRDEIHEYYDAKTHRKRKSLTHSHTLVSAYTDEKGINGKAFETKARLNQFNNAINRMVLREFGIEYNTHETPSHKSVEELKAESREAEAVERAREAERNLNRANIAAVEMSAHLANLKSFIGEEKYPTGVEIVQKGFGKNKRDYAVVPKDVWEAKMVSHEAVEAAQKAHSETLNLLALWKQSTTGKREKTLVSELEKTQKELYHANYLLAVQRNAEKEILERINSVLKRIDREAAEQFVREWKKQEDKQKGKEDEYER